MKKIFDKQKIHVAIFWVLKKHGIFRTYDDPILEVDQRKTGCFST